MFTEYLNLIKNDFVLLSFITFAVLYLVYMVVIKMHVAKYERKNSKPPMHYKMFRLYSKNLVNNAPSKKEKQFYIATNKITWFFNTLTLVFFVAYLIIVFR
ncbi:hypothetical protein GCM10023093_18610 [Nemorincola caseinilytica]|uniref:DUF3899 domain-containing protein n=1 Tax=Nemorincola caseinilytica TaxID=2054315 RepID=A0ABP8NI13_9BACT